jgi:hypothetical protein
MSRSSGIGPTRCVSSGHGCKAEPGNRKRSRGSRTMDAPDRVVVSFSRWKVTRLLLTIGLILVVCAHFMGQPNRWMAAAGACAVVFAGLFAAILLYRLARQRTALILDREGIEDRSSVFRVFRIRWDESRPLRSSSSMAWGGARSSKTRARSSITSV